MLSHFLLVGLGGAIGSMLRYGTGLLSIKFLGVHFPWGTLTVNILGSFCIGMAFALLSLTESMSENIKLFTMVGILGGFTTFSAFSLDTILLFERGQYLSASLYMASSVILSILATLAGLMLIRASLS
jgi:fluoride exporter